MESALDIGCFDLDIVPQDAALEDGNRPTRRMLANARIGVEPFDACYAACEQVRPPSVTKSTGMATRP